MGCTVVVCICHQNCLGGAVWIIIISIHRIGRFVGT